MDNNAARREIDALLNEGIKTASHFLKKSREFYPFGVALTPDGKMCHLQTWGGNDHPTSNEVLAILYPGLKQGVREGKYKAVAIVTDVKIRKPRSYEAQDAISIQIEHPDSAPIACYMPYLFEGAELVFGDLAAQQTDARVIGAAD